MMNIPINHSFKVPDIEDPFIFELLKKFSSNGYINIMYAHMGQLFQDTKPNNKGVCKKYCDFGADIVLTVHHMFWEELKIIMEK